MVDADQFVTNNRGAIERYRKTHALGQYRSQLNVGDCLSQVISTTRQSRHLVPIAHRKTRLPPAKSNTQLRSFFLNRASIAPVGKRGLRHASSLKRLSFGRTRETLMPFHNHSIRHLTTLSTSPCSTQISVLAENTTVSPSRSINKTQFNAMIAQAAHRHQVDEKLVHAVIQTESAYNANATSSAGAVGLMQLMPGTAKQYGVTDRNDPIQNINGGTRYLRYLLDLFHSNMDLAVAAYNAGEHTVMKYNYSIPPFPETRNYVRQVLALYNS
jgi:hypothetical protein